MGNLGMAEIVVIVVVALVVLGPTKLPQAARQLGRLARQMRRLASGFQEEFQKALDEPLEAEARERGQAAVQSNASPKTGTPAKQSGADGGPETDTSAGEKQEVDAPVGETGISGG